MVKVCKQLSAQRDFWSLHIPISLRSHPSHLMCFGLAVSLRIGLLARCINLYIIACISRNSAEGRGMGGSW